MFEIGQHIICIDNSLHETKLILNKIYTIKGFEDIRNFKFFINHYCGNYSTLLLEEVQNLYSDYYYETVHDIGFATIRFRPLSKLTVEHFKDVSLPIKEVMKEFLEFAV